MTAIDAAAGYGFPDAGVAAAAGLWGLDPAVAMLNHGGFGACPIAVLRRQAELRRQMEAEPVRFFLKELPPLRDAARQELASWLGAGPEDLVFLPNATAGVNSVLRSLRFRPGDELLVTDHGYNACTNVARYVARRDAARLVVVAVPLPVESPRQVIDSVLAGVSGRTRLAILDHVTSPSGVVFPIEELVRRLGAVGVDTLVDGAHAPGMISLDLGRIGAAYYTGNLHKWACTPKGAGFLHVRPDRQEGLQPPIISHGYNQARPGYSRFQDAFDWMGTDDPTAWLCVGEALDLLGRLLPGGREALADRNRRCVLAARRMLCGRLGAAPLCPESMIGSIAAMRLPGDPGPAVALLDSHPLSRELLERFAIEVPVYTWPDPPWTLLRISAQAYNHPGQYRRLADALEVLLAAKIR